MGIRGSPAHAEREVIERSLAHVVKSKTEAAYNRADLLDRRRALMTDWQRYLEFCAAQRKNVGRRDQASANPPCRPKPPGRQQPVMVTISDHCPKAMAAIRSRAPQRREGMKPRLDEGVRGGFLGRRSRSIASYP